MISKYPLRVLVFLQLLLILIAFNKAWVHPQSYFFLDHSDGYKNYLTYYGYLADDNNSLAKFEGMNYPFGEYIFYTDNTPSFALPLKLISRYLVDLTGVAFPLFHLFIILGILLSSIFCWQILRRFIKTPWIVLIFSVALPWLTPQFLRIGAGHYNLSFSWILLWVMFLSVRLEERWPEGRKAQIIGLGWLLFALIFASFTHLYYIAIAGVGVGAYFFGRILWPGEESQGQWKRFGLAIATVVLALASVLLTIQLTDGYYAERRTVAEGYDFNEWRLNFWAFYTQYEHLSLPTPWAKDRYIFLETQAFLSTFLWYFLIFLFLYRVLEPTAFRRFWQGRKLRSAETSASEKGKIAWFYAFLFAGAVGAFIGLGETILLFGKYKIPNLLNPFLYLHFLTDRVEQFRCIGRFSWFFFWAINFLMIYWFDLIWRQNDRVWVRRVMIILLVVVGFEAVETVSFQNDLFRKNKITNPEYTGDAIQLAEAIDPNDFQAILPLPYFAAGSEVYPMTIDPPESMFQIATQLYVQTGLPLMAYKMSRTSVDQTEAQLSMFLEEKPKAKLTDRLNDKAILIFYYKELNEDFSWYTLNMEPSKTVALGAKSFLEKYQPEEIYQNNKYILYRLDVSKLKK